MVHMIRETKKAGLMAYKAHPVRGAAWVSVWRGDDEASVTISRAQAKKLIKALESILKEGE